MSKKEDEFDKSACAMAILVIVVLLLVFNAVIDTWANYRDMYHLFNLQRRVGALEQQLKGVNQ